MRIIMILIYSDKGEILTAPESEDSENIDGNTVSIRFYCDDNGWKYSLAIKIARCIRFKPCLQQDQYLSSKAECKIEARRLLNTWLTKPQKKIYNQFLILEAEQQELPFYD